MSELNVNTGNWVGLRNGEVRGPVTVSEDKPDQFPVYIQHDQFFFSWSLDGREFDNGGESSLDIVAVLPYAPLERIRLLEEALRDIQKQARHLRGEQAYKEFATFAVRKALEAIQ